MMLTSKPVKGSDALNLGLVDAVVNSDKLVSTARQWALEILERRKPWVSSSPKTEKLEPLGEAREILKFARAQSRKQAPNLKQPLVCIDVIEEGIVSGPITGLWKEAEAFQQLLQSDTCKALVYIFFAQRGTSKVPCVTDRNLAPRRVRTVAVVGGGLMGSGIATALILTNLQSRVKKGNMTREKFEKTMSLLKGTLEYQSFKDMDLVIEFCTCHATFGDCSHSAYICPGHCGLARYQEKD